MTTSKDIQLKIRNLYNIMAINTMESIVLCAIAMTVLFHSFPPFIAIFQGNFTSDMTTGLLFTLLVNIPVLAYMYKKWFHKARIDKIPFKDKYITSKFMSSLDVAKDDIYEIVKLATADREIESFDNYYNYELRTIKSILDYNFEVTADIIDITQRIVKEYYTELSNKEREKLIQDIRK